MTHPTIVPSKIAHSQQLKSFGTIAPLKFAMLMLMIAAATTLGTAQTFTVLHSFDDTEGRYPTGLVQAPNGSLYGTMGPTETSGVGVGKVFKITPTGTLSMLHTFCSQGLPCLDGYNLNGLVLGPEGDFFGTSMSGGADGGGTVFKITPSGTLTTLYNFCAQNTCPGGSGPEAGLVEAVDGNFYGTTYNGGVNGIGTVFKIMPSGTLTVLYSFGSQTGDGSWPTGRLIQVLNGDFYGTTSEYMGPGTIFKITPSGKLTPLHTFCSQSNCIDGRIPTGLVEASDGNVYGTTGSGGANHWTIHGCYGGCGTFFKIAPNGKLTRLYSFCPQSDCRDGSGPGGLVQGTDGNFYGMTGVNGAYGWGTIFMITPRGKLTTLYNFCSQTGCPDGSDPIGLVQATNGSFYGTMLSGGSGCEGQGCGTVFSLSVGLGPFVRLISTTAKVGVPITVLGQGLTGTTTVSFNGTPAAFKVWSDTHLRATVPDGATTGVVTVITPSDTLTSNDEFRVRPVVLNVIPASGAAGTPVVITGTSFTQATKVRFGGGAMAASFTVDSDTQITATVPAGAPTGYIVLTTAGGKSRSPDTFTVTP